MSGTKRGDMRAKVTLSSFINKQTQRFLQAFMILAVGLGILALWSLTETMIYPEKSAILDPNSLDIEGSASKLQDDPLKMPGYRRATDSQDGLYQNIHPEYSLENNVLEKVVLGSENYELSFPQSKVPSLIQKECFLLDDYEWFRINVSENVLGWGIQKPLYEIQSAIEGQLIANGWIPINSNESAMKTFIKNGGHYRWALITYNTFQSLNTVVFQVLPTNEN